MSDFDLFGELEKDSKIDEMNLDHELTRIPYLQSKWMKHYIRLNRDLRQAERHANTVKLVRSNYYLGLASDDVYRQAPLNRKILKTDLPDVLAADPELSQAREDMEILRDVTLAVEKFISSLNNRGYNLKAAVDYLRWKNGG